jgi:hypothetical protein
LGVLESDAEEVLQEEVEVQADLVELEPDTEQDTLPDISAGLEVQEIDQAADVEEAPAISMDSASIEEELLLVEELEEVYSEEGLSEEVTAAESFDLESEEVVSEQEEAVSGKLVDVSIEQQEDQAKKSMEVEPEVKAETEVSDFLKVIAALETAVAEILSEKPVTKPGMFLDDESELVSQRLEELEQKTQDVTGSESSVETAVEEKFDQEPEEVEEAHTSEEYELQVDFEGAEITQTDFVLSGEASFEEAQTELVQTDEIMDEVMPESPVERVEDNAVLPEAQSESKETSDVRQTGKLVERRIKNTAISQIVKLRLARNEEKPIPEKTLTTFYEQEELLSGEDEQERTEDVTALLPDPETSLADGVRLAENDAASDFIPAPATSIEKSANEVLLSEEDEFRIKLWNNKRSKMAFAEYKVAMAYSREESDEKRAEAYKWYLRAAENGHAVSQFNLGNIYYTGRGVKQDYAQAADWYELAAEQGVARAQDNLGLMYFHGRGREVDPEEAVYWFYQAAIQGYPPAQFKLALHLEAGVGVDENREEALNWYKRAAAQGDASAQEQVDRMENGG